MVKTISSSRTAIRLPRPHEHYGAAVVPGPARQRRPLTNGARIVWVPRRTDDRPETARTRWCLAGLARGPVRGR